MGQTIDEIESHIYKTREDLRSNLEELEGRVKSAVDWRERFRRNPGLGMALALGGGFLLASLTARPRRARVRYESAPIPYPRRSHLQHLLDNVQSTLIGIAAARASDLVIGLVLGGLGPGRSGARPAESEEVQGEGDYRAARRYRRSAESFAQSADVERAARRAAPRSAREADAMAEAEAEGRGRGLG